MTRVAAGEAVTTIDWRRVTLLTATGFFLVVAVWELPIMVSLINTPPDFVFYRDAAQRWLDTGAFYQPEQLAGPYEIVLNRSVLYPPTALYLFVPFVFLPAALFWASPIGVVAYALFRWRPAMWTWPILAATLAWKTTMADLLLGNSDLWVSAGVAGGLLWGWPAAFLVLKPSFGLLALVGIRHRSWWLAALVLGVLSLPMIPLWIDYLAVVRNSGMPLTYSLGAVPMVLAPLVAWIGRRGPRQPKPAGALGRVG